MSLWILTFVLIVTTAGLGLRLYLGRAEEGVLRSGEQVAIGDLRDPLPANAFLLCPPGYCTATATPSPEFAASREQLEAAWGKMLATERDIVAITDEPQQHRSVVIQHSRLLRFPDIVTVEFIDMAPNRSSLAIYSRARYGRSDFGVNRLRVLGWLKRLQQIAPAAY